MKLTYNYRNAFRILKGGKISLVVAALVAGSTILSASPSGGVVTSGSSTINQIGSVTTINQASQKTTINWQNFSIAKDETVNFIQPNSSSIALNRVVGNEQSIINGALNANGQVWILNSNGVLFGKDASINTAALLATTKTLSDTDFNAGNYNFKGDSSASVINMGTITISNSGYAALLANSVSNQGTITAIRGTVELVGANEATINLNGNSLVSLHVSKGVLDALVENKGAIIADGGEIILTTNAVNELLKGVVNNTGVVEANSLDDVTGKVTLFAHGGTTNVSGSINAKGGSVETSGESLHVSRDTTIKAKDWLLDPTDITIESTGGTDLAGSSISADTIDTTLNGGTNVTLTADNNINVNQNMTWNAATTLTLTAGNQINVNAIIDNTNATNGGVYFQAANTTNDVIFGTNGKVIINNPYQLQWMNTALGGTYELGSNIDASGTSSWNSGAGFVPIGDYYTNYFTGTLDGLGHTISGLTIYLPEQWYVGLFGAIKDNALIQNIGLVNETITGNLGVGGLVGENEATVINAYTTGSIFGNAGVGGLVGRNYYSSITDSYSTASVTGIPDSDSSMSSTIGGLVGVNFGGSITDSYATGSVIGNGWIGGLVGYNLGTSTITNSYATGSVSATVIGVREGTYITGGIGGLVGNNTGTITNSYATGDVTGYLAATGPSGEGFDGAYVGGLAGINDGTIINSYATGDVIGRNDVGGLVGGNWLGLASSITNSYATGNVTGSAYFGGFIGANEGSVTDSYSTGNVTLSAIGDPYVLFPDGAGSSGYISGYLGGFVGNNSGTITNSYATGSVTGSNYVGGFVGYNNTGTITNAYWDKDTSGQSSAIGGNYGGITTNLVGINSSTGTINTFTQATYTGFDFANTWVIYDGYTYPLLRTFMRPITVTANDVTGTYNGSAYAGNGVAYSDSAYNASLVSGTLRYIYGTNSVTGTVDETDAGVSSITTSGLYSSQQGYLITNTDGTLTVNPKTLTASLSSQTKTYDGGDSASLTSGDYSMDTGITGESFTINQTSGIYNSKDVLTANIVTATLGSSNFIPVSGTLASNYTLPTTAIGTGSVTAKTVTASGFSSADKVYDGGTVAVVNGTASLQSEAVGAGSSSDGKVYATDTVSLSGNATGTFNSKDVLTANSVSFLDLSIAGTDATNYTLVQPASVIQHITAKTLTASLSSQTKTYDGGDSASLTSGDYSMDTGITGESFTINQTSGIYNSKDVLTANIVTATLGSSNFIPVSGTLASNYTLPTTAIGTGSVTAKTVTASGFSSADKVYDGGTVAVVNGTASLQSEAVGAGSSSDGKVYATDTVSLSGNATGTFNSKDVLTANSVSFLDLSIAGTDATNYTLVQPASVIQHITPIILTPTLSNTGVSKTYDGTTATPVGFTPTSTPSGLLAGDSITLADTGALYNSKDVANANQVTVSGLSIASVSGNAIAGDYALGSTTQSVLAVVTPAYLSVTANSLSKMYGMSDPALTYKETGLAAGDSLSGSLTRTAGEQLGHYDILEGTLMADANYIMNFIPEELTIKSDIQNQITTITQQIPAGVSPVIPTLFRFQVLQGGINLPTGLEAYNDRNNNHGNDQ